MPKQHYWKGSEEVPGDIWPSGEAMRRETGAFETVLVYKGKPLFRERHETRLRGGLKILGIPWQEKYFHNLWNTLKTDPDLAGKKILRLRISVSGRTPDIFLEAWEWNHDPWFATSTARARVNGFAPDTAKGQASVKRMPRTYYEELEREATRGFYAVVRKHDSSDELAEGTRANLFILHRSEKKGSRFILSTPPWSSGCLPGIMRSVILEEAPACGITVYEKPMVLKELPADGLPFFSNVFMGMMQITELTYYPLKFEPKPEVLEKWNELKQALLRRREKEVSD